MGHEIECGRIVMKEGEIAAIRNWEILKSVIQLWFFLILANYYMWLEEWFFKRASLPIKLLKKDI